MGFEGRVAIVTGAAYGNGRGIALKFADEGADIVIADIQAERMEETAEMVRSRGRRALVHHCDVSKKVEIDQLVETSVAEFGAIHIAVANAGVVEADTDCLRMTESQWDRTIDVNLKGVFFTLQAAARRMVEQGPGGRLIAIASIMAEWGSAGAPAYCASKGGVRQLVRSFAHAVGPHGSTCNGIGPGFIETGMTEAIQRSPAAKGFLVDRTPSGRLGVPSDIGNAASFLASEDASFMNGAMVYPDGGITSGMFSSAGGFGAGGS